MRRSESSKGRLAANPKRRSVGGGLNHSINAKNIAPINASDLLGLSNGNNVLAPRRPSCESATAIGRSLLDRPKGKDYNSSTQRHQQHRDTQTNDFYKLLQQENASNPFTACSAITPIPIRRCQTADTVTLKSCLSSSSSSLTSGSSAARRRRYQTKKSTSMPANSSNATFDTINNNTPKIRRNVSFSHSQVRTYETTLGDNPSVSSGVPISLGWKYDPHETLYRLDNTNSNSNSTTSMENSISRISKSMDELRLSDTERRSRIINSNNSISSEDLRLTIQSIKNEKLVRKKSLEDLRIQQIMMKKMKDQIKRRGF